MDAAEIQGHFDRGSIPPHRSNSTLDVGEEYRLKYGRRTEHRCDRCLGEQIELWRFPPYWPLPFIATKWALGSPQFQSSARGVFPNGGRADWHPICSSARIAYRNMW